MPNICHELIIGAPAEKFMVQSPDKNGYRRGGQQAQQQNQNLMI
ncbi:MAG: hypothetical protein ABIN89_04345 [Chitinophagaceae bacterium]